MHGLPFPHSQTKSIFPLQLIHSDVWGPAPKISINGFKYTCFFPIVKKFHVTAIFKCFKPLIENQLSSPIQILRTDGGGEFVNHNLKSYLESNGILHQKSCAHTPEQNDVAEREHRHIVEVVISLMTRASILVKFLSFAFSATVLLINRLPSSSLNKTSLILNA